MQVYLEGRGAKGWASAVLRENKALDFSAPLSYNVGQRGEMDGKKIIAENRKARFNYFVEESIECGIALEGSEVKSVRGGSASLVDAFAAVEGGEVWVRGMHIAPYRFSGAYTPEPLRRRKLLLHKEQIKRLIRKTNEKGYTLVPLDIYFKNGKVKVNLGICKGKKQFDKRNAIRERDIDREAQRAFKAGGQ